MNKSLKTIRLCEKRVATTTTTTTTTTHTTTTTTTTTSTTSDESQSRRRQSRPISRRWRNDASARTWRSNTSRYVRLNVGTRDSHVLNYRSKMRAKRTLKRRVCGVDESAETLRLKTIRDVDVMILRCVLLLLLFYFVCEWKNNINNNPINHSAAT